MNPAPTAATVEGPTPPTGGRRPALMFIFVTFFLDVLGIGLIIPVLPRLVEQLVGGDTSHAARAVGVLGAVYSLMQFLFSPALGSLSDRFGRRPVILGSLFGSGLDYLLLWWAPSLSWLFLGRVISGITGANVSAATAYIADISPPEKRAANFGVIGAAFGLGFVAGPALGGLLGSADVRLPFLVAAGMTLLNWLYGFFVLPESLAPENRRSFSWAGSNPVSSFVGLGRWPVVRGLAESFFLFNVAQFALHSVWVLYTSYRYGWSSTQVGLSLAVVGVTAAVIQGGLARRIIPALGEARSMRVGFLISGVTMLGYGLATRGWMIYALLVFGSLGFIAGPAVQGLISCHVPANEQGGVQGALASLRSVAGIIAPLLGTGLFGYFISPGAWTVLPGASFFMGAGLIAVAFWLAARTLHRHPQAK
ncbi:MAG TPA: TCR/Tet family MFS transporter [Verrucomicrobiae bacterium]